MNGKKEGRINEQSDVNDKRNDHWLYHKQQLPLHRNECIFASKNRSIIQPRYVDCFRWPVAHNHIKFNMLSFGQRTCDTPFIFPSYRFAVHEHIFLCIITFYETVAFLNTIEFNNAGNSARFGRWWSIRTIWHGSLCFCSLGTEFCIVHSHSLCLRSSMCVCVCVCVRAKERCKGERKNFIWNFFCK